MIARIIGLIIWLTALFASIHSAAADTLARSILVLNQSEVSGPFYYQIFSGLRAAVNANTGSHTTLYSENLDLSRFEGTAYQETLQRHLKEKYRDRPIGVVVAVGSATLSLVLRWREELWPDTPVVFAMLDEPGFAQLKPPPDITGAIVNVKLADTIAAARAVVPNLKRIVFVGDAWDSQVVFRHWKDEIASVSDLS